MNQLRACTLSTSKQVYIYGTRTHSHSHRPCNAYQFCYHRHFSLGKPILLLFLKRKKKLFSNFENRNASILCWHIKIRPPTWKIFRKTFATSNRHINLNFQRDEKENARQKVTKKTTGRVIQFANQLNSRHLIIDKLRGKKRTADKIGFHSIGSVTLCVCVCIPILSHINKTN